VAEATWLITTQPTGEYMEAKSTPAPESASEGLELTPEEAEMHGLNDFMSDRTAD
jgi:hypothetical protein